MSCFTAVFQETRGLLRLETSKGRQKNLQSLGIIGSLLDYGIIVALGIISKRIVSNHWTIGYQVPGDSM